MHFWPSQGPVPTKKKGCDDAYESHSHMQGTGHGNEINRGRNEWTQKDEWSVMRAKKQKQGAEKYWNEKYNWQKILFRFICKAEHSINFRALNIVSDHKSWLHLRTHTHTLQTNTHTHPNTHRCSCSRGREWARGPDGRQMHVVVLVPCSWKLGCITGSATTTGGQSNNSKTAKNTKRNPCNNKKDSRLTINSTSWCPLMIFVSPKMYAS